MKKVAPEGVREGRGVVAGGPARSAGGRMLSRRRFLGVLPGAALAAGSGGPRRVDTTMARTPAPPASAVETVRYRRQVGGAIGIQLYTVRSLMAEDPGAVLAALAEIGYREVELAGLYGMEAGAMRALLDAAGLAAVSGHHPLEEVRGAMEALVETALTLGQSLVVVPSIPAGERDGEALRRVADDFNRAGEVARASGLRFGYHNHDWEMHPGVGGTPAIDLLLDRTDPELVDWQMDIYWTVHGGADPLAELEARAGRVTSVHVKDRTDGGEMVAVGTGSIDFGPVLARARELGLRHQFVEHDNPEDPLASARASYRALVELASAELP